MGCGRNDDAIAVGKVPWGEDPIMVSVTSKVALQPSDPKFPTTVVSLSLFRNRTG